ncbi:MAG TPA: zf-HC2 domain-containing protein [Methylomirabilota bacterium]|nr:zf-HC2 domain-containing protein [Methylomirabilota bacterium]
MHPETELIALVRDELAPAERARVAAHLEGCAECRRAAEESRALLQALAASAPPPPAVDWGRYQADLRARVGARRAWWRQPVPTMLAAGVATALVVFAVHGLQRTPSEVVTLEETMLGARLPMLQQYQVVERLDMLEDLDAIRQLDRLGGER